MSNEKDPTILRKRRGCIKASCTRVKTYVDSIESITPSVRAQLEERRIRLDSYWSEYDDIQLKLEMLDESEAQDRAGFEEAFYALCGNIRELLHITCTMNGTSGPALPAPEVRDTIEPIVHVKLPKLNLPTFSGKYDEWFPFFETFSSIIHSNASLSNTQKFQYLRASLSGDAGNVTNSLELTEANYEVAWSLLKQRYDNKRVIVYTHIKAIMDLPSMFKENSEQLRQISDGAARHIHALQALKRPTSHWDDLLVYVLSSKFDSVTLREWQASLSGSDLPTLKQISDFIAHRCQVLEATGKSNTASIKNALTKPQYSNRRQMSCASTVNFQCYYCNGEHSIYNCKGFLALPISQRISQIRSRGICTNCLRSRTHKNSKCPSGNCKTCKAKHNTLLHIIPAKSSIDPDAGNSDIIDKENSTPLEEPRTLSTHATDLNNKHIMLSTAIVYVQDVQGVQRPCRVLLDSGSQANFISRKFLATLKLKSHASNVCISGINGVVSKATDSVLIKFQSRLNSFSDTIECIVTEQVTTNLPAYTLKRSMFEFPHNLELADPQFNVSSNIDLLIGAESFWDLLCVGQVKATIKHPTLQKTRLGWILAGRLHDSSKTSRNLQALHTTVINDPLHDQLALFWKLEDVSDASNNYTLEEKRCEEHFMQTVHQNNQGRYVVDLPIKEQLINEIGDSQDIALKRLLGLERRLERNPTLRIQYMKFLSEYLELGHMKPVQDNASEGLLPFYMPHHCVFKGSKQSIKLRVVFDASCKSDSGVSLNDVLLVGPVVQQDLVSILMRFRTFIYVLVADIIKMYRQILVNPAQTRLQRILWRTDPSSEVKIFELNTVTYGTACASYLATRCLQHLADRYASEYPVGSVHVKRDFYVDDLLTGADTLQEAKLIRNEIINLLRLGAFELSKWASNNIELLESTDSPNESLITIDKGDAYVLGMQWNQITDSFHFNCEADQEHGPVSKRSILSDVSKLFDPLGLLGPIIVVSKLIIQDLWQSGVHWDESVPQDIHSRWLKFKSQLFQLNQLQIPRCVRSGEETHGMQIHGFCDASQRAYGACIYIRTRTFSNEHGVRLLCSKSRVAPIKVVSIPRLELSAALLLARLVAKLEASFGTANVPIILWSDSTIVLNWINSVSRRWSVFVGNRVGEVQRLTAGKSWRYVSTNNNPADILSRGLGPHELLNNTRWWHGPEFLTLNEELWPNSDFTRLGNAAPEQRSVLVTATIVPNCIVTNLTTRISSLYKMCRIIAYCLRFLRKHRPDSPTTFVSHKETDYALHCMCKVVQRQAFNEEYKALIKGNCINSSSRLISLSPFMDDRGILRVGGRLENSELPYEPRHPILLPNRHEVTKRIIEHEHIRSMHAGTQATMAAVRQRFWPLSLRSTTRQILLNCVTCFKARPSHSEAIMGSLPASRINISRPFSQCGVDYAGPITLKEGKRRNARNSKAYISIFVCFATKATHIELVSDLTTDSFIAALKRFISRRGKPDHIYSDNGTTFVGAKNQLQEIYDFLKGKQVQDNVREFLREQRTSWTFIPPNAPHVGGLWEAAVKSAKYHLARIVGKAHLVFEEMQTILSEIEAILNSRPITPLSEDPNDLSYLSPGHFLVGTTMNSFPCRDLQEVNENRLLRWERVEQLRQHFWNRWSHEYLHSLQARSKWRFNKGTQLAVDQLVLISQPGLAPLKWILGRVQEVHVGADDIARSATVKTARGVLVRTLPRLAILPISKD